MDTSVQESLDLSLPNDADSNLLEISNSEIQTFKECRRKWWLQYYRRLGKTVEPVTGALALGTRLHDCLEMFYTEDVDMLAYHDKLVKRDRIQLQLRGEDESGLDADASMGYTMLEGYLSWLENTGADAAFAVVSAEEKLSSVLTIDQERVKLIGKLDMRIRRLQDNAKLFLDHKTTAQFGDLVKTAHMAEQFYTYHLLENLCLPAEERCVGGVYNMLKKSKRTARAQGPFYDRLEVRHNNASMESFWIRLHGELIEIMRLRKSLDSGADHRYVAYPTPTKDWTWKCPFFDVCPMFDDGSRAEEMLQVEFEPYDPYKRYMLTVKEKETA